MRKIWHVALLLVCTSAIPVWADTTLVFNEVMYHPNAGTNEAAFEWVEFYNQLAVDLDVSGWTVSGDLHFVFPMGTRVAGRSFVVLAADPATIAAMTGLPNIFGPLTNRLSNSGGSLELHNAIGRLMDHVNFGTDGDWPVAPDGSGASLAKRDPDLGSAAAQNWNWSRQVSGTPGADNFATVVAGKPIALTSGWKYDASGTDLGTAWRQLSYNDSAWPSRIGFTNQSVATLFNTGVGANGMGLQNNTTDPHYILTAAAQGTVGANALAISNHSAWAANNTNSSWIGILDPGTTSVAAGGYSYQTTFSLTGLVPATVQIYISAAVDDNLTNVFLNGVPTGLASAGYAAFISAGVLTNGFNPGVNTIEFRTVNGSAGAHGFRAQFTSSALAVNTNTPMTAGRSTYYLRNAFVFPGSPGLATLTFNTILADGAVVYLNGVEVYRQNMPAGPVSYATAALSNVTALAYSGPVTLSASNLVTGTNILAVEVHQAAGSPDPAAFGADVNYTIGSLSPLSLAFNEFSATTNTPFWLEVLNYGTNAAQLDGMVIYDDATGTNYQYAFPSGTSLAPGAFVCVTNTALGFIPVSGDKLYLYSSNGIQVCDAMIAKKGPRARWPDGTGEWLVPGALTPNGSNNISFRNELVINEIMYDQHLLAASNSLPPQPNPEAWIELYNRGTNTVDLTGWELGGGVNFKFPAGKTIAPGAYLVVADDAVTLRANYPSIDVVGNLGGRLSHSDDTVTLKDPTGNPANKVHYYEGGRWPEYAAGGGSSLELRDPFADNSQAETWAASDESGRTAWQTYSYRMTAVASVTASPDNVWREFVLGLLSSGECFIDDISVLQSPDSNPLQYIDNGNFEGGITNWRAVGNHVRCRVEPEPGNAANHVLHVVSTGMQEHMHNHVETTLAGGRTVTNGQVYQISFRARWLAGNNLLNTRLYFNRCARTTALPMPLLTGTPGARNSRYATNIGPTFAQFQHQPLVPSSNQAATVSVLAKDSAGISTCDLWWATNGGAWSNASMTLQRGVFAQSIPSYPAGTLVQFYVRAVDGLGAVSTFPAAGADSAALYRVNDGLANVALTHNLRILMTPANTALLHDQTNAMSNDTLPCTVIYDERRAYYDMRVRLKSSERGRTVAARVGFHLEFPPHDLFRGVHPVMLVDRSAGSTRPAQEEIVLKHMALRAGLHIVNSDICRVLAPQSAQNGPAILAPRYEDEFVDASFSNGGNGTLFELELTYYPSNANTAGYKLPQPDGVQGTDFSDLGMDKEAYRYNFLIKNHRAVDDYSTFINAARIWSTNGTVLDTQTKMTMAVHEWLKVYAHVSLCGVTDMYTFGNNHNLMCYIRPNDGQLLYFPWDMDFSFTPSSVTGPLVGNSGSPAPNLTKIINLPGNLRRLYAYMLDEISTTFNTTYMGTWLTHYGPFSGQDYSGDATYIQQRGDFAKTTIASAGGSANFTIAGNDSITNGSNVITLTGTAPVTMTSITVNGMEYPITWSSISTWTMTIPVSAASNSLNVVGTALNGNTVSNLARTVYYTNALPDPMGSVMFSEIMYNPAVPGAAYVELFNASSNFVFDLSGWRIHGLDFTFPSGTVISNRQYLVVTENVPVYYATYGFAAGVPAGTFSGAFQLDGETLTLIKPGATPAEDVVVDKVRYDGVLPWPNYGPGTSLQLVDAAQDNSRVANWTSSFVPTRTNDGWRFISLTGTWGTSNTSTRLLLFLDGAGSIVLDDISIVSGTVPEVGPNYVQNGNFETALDTNVWKLGTNMLTTTIISNVSHSGLGALRLVQTNAGGFSTIGRDLSQVVSPSPASAQTVTISLWYLATNTTATSLTFRIVSSLLSVSANVNIQVTAPTNLISPGATNFAAANVTAFPPLWINEIQPDNANGLQDSYGQRDPWLELYNAGTNTVSLDGLYLSLGYSNLTQWPFPAGITIAPHGFKMVWCDAQPDQTSNSELHASFRLPGTTGSVALARIDRGQSQVVDYINYSGIHSDRSYGSFPDGQPFDRQEFFYVTPGGTNNGTSAPLSVVINEWMAANTIALADPADDDFDDWFELYNPTTNAVDIAGYYLTDTITNKFQYKITTNGPHVIPAGGHLLVWADNETGQNTSAGGAPRLDLHVNFQLSKTGEVIGMFAPDGTQIDFVTFGPQTNDVSQGRYPDGSANIVFMPGTASPRAANHVSGVANTPPVLGVIGNRYGYAAHTLSFSLSATDADAPAQQLAFTLDPGAPDGSEITGSTCSWTPISPGSYTATIRVTDSGTPPMSDTETITIDVYPVPRFGTMTLSGTNLVLNWDAQAGQTYRIETKTDLGAPTWDWLRDITASGSTLSLTNSTGVATQLFYRITVSP